MNVDRISKAVRAIDSILGALEEELKVRNEHLVAERVRDLAQATFHLTVSIRELQRAGDYEKLRSFHRITRPAPVAPVKRRATR